MRPLRILCHATYLALLNLGAIVVGFMTYFYVLPLHQLLVQIPIAAVLSILGLMAWMLLTQWGPLHFLKVREPIELVAIYLATWVCACVIFIPAHYVAEGYLTSMGNLVALGFFQAAVNLIGLSGCALLIRTYRRA